MTPDENREYLPFHPRSHAGKRIVTRARRHHQELKRLYSRESLSAMSMDSWSQRNDEILTAIFNWE